MFHIRAYKQYLHLCSEPNNQPTNQPAYIYEREESVVKQHN